MLPPTKLRPGKFTNTFQDLNYSETLSYIISERESQRDKKAKERSQVNLDN